MLHKVSIAGLTMDPASNTPIIILKSEVDEQAIPIWIGLLEATSIASALQNIKEGIRYVAKAHVTRTFMMMGFILPLFIIPIFNILTPSIDLMSDPFL